ncbi:uncharacterized protein N0V89_011798 [Didymosphaeria variabile]|uniref:Uncharacterized protein n=1 Tax=Didymosphaeria variabile TaxID=1932322 RepID=A0A9W9C6Q6_9PLEO|nr:uncharacterized protein N0V89_011798 [Didymosphaeria variabile]KAJ4345663.1 hypothetical protein N0V89_011798 [Didymosphaeria variabile]
MHQLAKTSFMLAESAHNHDYYALSQSNIMAQAGVKRMMIGDVSVVLVPTQANGMVLTFIRNLLDHGYNLVDTLVRKSLHMAVRATEDERLRAIVTNISRAAAHTIMESPAFASFAAQNAFRFSSATWLFYVDLPMTTSLRIGRYLRGRLMRLVDDGDVEMGGLDDVESQKGAAISSSSPFSEAASYQDRTATWPTTHDVAATPQKNKRKRGRKDVVDDAQLPRKRIDVKAEPVQDVKAEPIQDAQASLAGTYSAIEEEEMGSETKAGSKSEVLYRCTGICNDGQKCKRWSKHAAGEPLVWHCSPKHKEQWDTSVKILSGGDVA